MNERNDALLGVLGLVEAERFLVTVSRDKIHCTEWRRTGLPEMTDPVNYS